MWPCLGHALAHKGSSASHTKVRCMCVMCFAASSRACHPRRYLAAIQTASFSYGPGPMGLEYGPERLYDGVLTTRSANPAITPYSFTFPWMLVELDRAYNDIEMLSVWAADGYNDHNSATAMWDVSIWLMNDGDKALASAMEDPIRSLLCASGLRPASGTETIIFCYAVGMMPMRQVFLARPQSAFGHLAVQELRVWRGGECPSASLLGPAHGACQSWLGRTCQLHKVNHLAETAPDCCARSANQTSTRTKHSHTI